MPLNVGLDVSYDKTHDWKVIRQKAVEDNSTEYYVRDGKTYR
jgi:hypothetical protein